MQGWRKTRKGERAPAALALAAAVGAGTVLAILLFLLAEGLPAIIRTGWISFLFGPIWDPDRGLYGLAAPIIGTAWVIGGAFLLALPPGLWMAAFLSDYCPPALAAPVRWTLGLLAGIPSVVYGLAGMAVVVPAIRQASGGTGFSGLAGSMVLAMMILPTWVSLS